MNSSKMRFRPAKFIVKLSLDQVGSAEPVLESDNRPKSFV